MSAHTPGPWSVELDVAQEGDIDVMTPEMLMIARIDCKDEPDDDDSPPREVALANARLIAAAPDLLGACRSMVDWFDMLSKQQHELLVLGQSFKSASENWDAATMDTGFDMTAMRSAIAKAEGREP